MTWMFWLLYIPVVSFLAVIAYVISRVCDRLDALNAPTNDQPACPICEAEDRVVDRILADLAAETQVH
jgi:hypothetical protein